MGSEMCIRDSSCSSFIDAVDSTSARLCYPYVSVSVSVCVCVLVTTSSLLQRCARVLMPSPAPFLQAPSQRQIDDYLKFGIVRDLDDMSEILQAAEQAINEGQAETWQLRRHGKRGLEWIISVDCHFMDLRICIASISSSRCRSGRPLSSQRVDWFGL